jgi:thymidylate synthase
MILFVQKFTLKNKKMTAGKNPQFLNLENARESEQILVMQKIQEEGYCPFCPGNLKKNHHEETLRETDHWIVTKNQWPYEHTKLHLMLVLKYHAEKLTDISKDAAHEYIELIQWIEETYKVKGGMFGMRIGEPELSGATVRHLHGQYVVPDIETIGPGESVAFYIGKPKNQRELEVVNGFYKTEDRIVDNQYRNLLKKIMREGEETDPIHGQPAKEITGVTLRYDIRNGFPFVTERDMSKIYHYGLQEHEAFRAGKHTLEGLREHGLPDFFWEKWADEKSCNRFNLPIGDIGPGSYGHAFANFPTMDGKTFNQILAMERQMKEMPMLRTIAVSPWIPYFTVVGDPQFPRKVTVAPCHGWMFIKTNTRKKTFSLTHLQRSGDVPVGVAFNLVQYAAIGMMLERVTGLRFTELVYHIHNAHIYQCQYESVEELLKQPSRKLPTMSITREGAQSIYDFKVSDFILSDYESGPAMKINTPV